MEFGVNYAVDVYRRNLQRTYANHINDLMNSSEGSIHASDIKALLRDELESLSQQVGRAKNRSSDHMTIIHLRDIQSRIEQILDPS